MVDDAVVDTTAPKQPHFTSTPLDNRITLISAGGSLSFRGSNVIDCHRSGLPIFFTLAGSILGALLLLVIPPKALPLVIALFSAIKRQAGVRPTERQPTRGREIAGYGVTFVLGVYGGFFSGGYVTLLTAAIVALFGMTFMQAILNDRFYEKRVAG
jgi:hypothetical protein